MLHQGPVPGLLVTVEGIDGAGKTTLIGALASLSFSISERKSLWNEHRVEEGVQFILLAILSRLEEFLTLAAGQTAIRVLEWRDQLGRVLEQALSIVLPAVRGRMANS